MSAVQVKLFPPTTATRAFVPPGVGEADGSATSESEGATSEGDSGSGENATSEAELDAAASDAEVLLATDTAEAASAPEATSAPLPQRTPPTAKEHLHWPVRSRIMRRCETQRMPTHAGKLRGIPSVV